MGRAEDLYLRLESHGEAAIDGMIDDFESESLWLDFKNVATSSTDAKLSFDDRKNLAKAISGFGNSEGGIIIWGVNCKPNKNGDVPDCKRPLTKPAKFKSLLEGAVSGCTIPAHPHVEHLVVESDTFPDTGFVVTFIKRSVFRPHQSLVEGAEQYYMRSGSSFLKVPHALLAGMFGHPLSPELINTWLVADIDVIGNPRLLRLEVGLVIVNNGPGVVSDVFANLEMRSPGGSGYINIHSPENLVENWHLQTAGGGTVRNILSKNHFKLAPLAPAHIISIEYMLQPPFSHNYALSFSYGYHGGPTKMIRSTVTVKELQRMIVDYRRESEPHEKELLQALLPEAKIY